MAKPTTPTSGIGKMNARKADSAIEKEALSQFPLGRNNFNMMIIAGALIVIGFLLMLGGASTEEAFNPDIFSARRIVVGPTITFIGFLFMGYAIIRKPADKKATDRTDEPADVKKQNQSTLD